jgi:glycosyltransferase involved in cell wall biosynthesis
MKKRIVIFVGVLTEYQGVDLLLEAIPFVLEKAPHTKFLIVGYPNEEHYRRKARELGVESSVHFTGRVSYEDVPRYLALADIAVSPKISPTEANLKLFAYMAMGLPAIVFDSPTNREILGDVGVYVKSVNSTALADALIGVLSNHEWAQQLGALSRKKAADEYSWLGVGKKLGDIYSSIPHKRNGSNGSLNGPSKKEHASGKIKDIGDRRSRLYRISFNK